MDITLVTSTYNDDVHGTDNDKRTGCGISLFKPENITRFRRGDVMTDLKEITCEKCKAALAKKIIKSDKKEMSRIIKEEKLRAKKGIEDEGIVPLGNTTARITGQPRAASEPVRQPVQTPPPVQPAYNQPAYNQPVMNAPEPETVPQPAILPKNITGTNVPIDSSLAQFAINVPKEEDPVQEDDFLAQFAIQKPEEEEETVETVENTVPQNDFLAQFAIPSPAVQQLAEVYAPESAVPENSGMDDITFNEPAPDVDVVEQQYGESRYQNDDSIIDIEENEVSAVEPDDNLGTEDDDAEVDLTSVSEWNIVANQIFGFEGAEELNPDSDAEMEGIPAPVQQTAPVIEDIPAPVQQTAPVIEDIPAPVQQTAPVIDDIAAAAEAAASSFNRFTAPVQPVGVPVYPTQQTAPVIEDIPAPVQQTVPVIEDIPAPVQQTVPVIEDIPAPVQQTAPVIEDIPAPVQQTAPVIEDIPAPVQQTAPVIEDISEPVQQTAPVIDDIAAAAAAAAASFNRFTAPVQPVGVPVYPTKQTAPVIEDIPAPVQQTAPVIEDIPAPAPVPTPAPVPAQNDNERGMNMHIYSSGDITTAPAQPAPSVQQTAPVQPAPAVQKPAAVQPQIVNVPQFTGMDANGQPVYTYIQMQMTGYDASGKPILAPLPGQPAPQQMPQTAAPQTAAPQTPTAASTGYTVPTANISKIAVNQHTKPTSRAFVQAIANSKGYANKNLIETQGMQVNAPMLTSIEDVLSQIDTGSAARAQSGQPAAAPKKAAPVYNEYKANAQPASRMPASARPAPQQRHVEDDYRFMTKAEIKAKKKQDKIDAKFRKDMGKRGL
ncbi:MAG: hypothetical protein E7498_01505 [Ruminococcus sp.]|nr:hypothetical protein [Ruminococcus sp.]